MKKSICIFSFLLCVQFVFSNNETLNFKKPYTLKKEFHKTKNSSTKDSLTYYVLAKSGLNYREKPNGKVLGKFPLMTKVNIVKRTGIIIEVEEKGGLIKGQWVGVITKEASDKIVFVFDGFLATKKNITSFDIYDVQSYEENKKQIPFIVLTDSYLWDNSADVIHDKYLGTNEPKRHILAKDNRTIFLFKMGFKETDNVYIYNTSEDEISTFKVNELPLIAKPNAYGMNDNVEQYEYLIGFDLKDKDFSGGYHSFAYVSKKNPFVTGDIKPIIWEKTDEKTFPKVKIDSNNWLNHSDSFKEQDSIEFYTFKHNNYNYFLKIKGKKSMYTQTFHLIVTLKNDVVFNNFYSSSEGATPAPLSFKENIEQDNYLNQWTGKIFKDKPPILLGFMYYAFGCSGISFLDPSEEWIPILCDNRH